MKNSLLDPQPSPWGLRGVLGGRVDFWVMMDSDRARFADSNDISLMFGRNLEVSEKLISIFKFDIEKKFV